MKYLEVMVHNRHMNVNEISYIYQKVEKRVPIGRVWDYLQGGNDPGRILSKLYSKLFYRYLSYARGNSP
jgi:hypothetical protein